MIQGCVNSIPEATPIILTQEERAQLEGLARSTKTEYRMRQRARMVLLAAQGISTRAIGRAVRCTTGTASKWRVRYAQRRLAGLDETGNSAEAKYTAQTGTRILGILDTSPPKGYARWTGPLIAKVLGDVDVQYDPGVRARTLSLPVKQPRLSACTWRRRTMRSSSVSMKSPLFKRWSVRRVI